LYIAYHTSVICVQGSFGFFHIQNHVIKEQEIVIKLVYRSLEYVDVLATMYYIMMFCTSCITEIGDIVMDRVCSV